jgi:hypothetical protein
MHRRPLVLLALLGLVLPPLLPHADAARLRARLHKPRRGLQIRLAPVVIPSGSEREVCQVVTLRNRRPVMVDRMTMTMPSAGSVASHHFAVFLVQDPDDPNLPTEPVDSAGCSGVGGAIVSPILAFVQRPRQSLRFPPGVAVTLEPGQKLMLNSHYVNGATEDATVDVAMNLVRARRTRIAHELRSFQLGTTRIDVGPGADGAAVGEWIAPFPMNVVWLSTHSHKHTTHVDVELIRAGAPAGLELRTDRWAEPSVKQYRAAPLRLEPGDGLRWTCHYHNDRGERLRFGVTAEDEMCFAVGFFYPDGNDPTLPSVPGCFGNGRGLVCPFAAAG